MIDKDTDNKTIMFIVYIIHSQDILFLVSEKTINKTIKGLNKSFQSPGRNEIETNLLDSNYNFYITEIYKKIIKKRDI